MSEWQSIDTAPKDGTPILAYRPPAKIGCQQTLVPVVWSEEVTWWIWPSIIYDPYNPDDYAEAFLTREYYQSDRFTHWMPLPIPPKE